MEPTHRQHHTLVGRSNWYVKVLMGLVMLLTLLVIAALLIKVILVPASGRTVKSKQFQAVFLTNGQVYFGKLSQLDSKYVKLTNIYYLTQKQDVQSSGTQSDQKANLQLTPLGNEIHGPENAMYINHDQVLFWENLKDDGQVVKAIKSSQSK